MVYSDLPVEVLGEPFEFGIEGLFFYLILLIVFHHAERKLLISSPHR